ncbi:hypothetical protein FRC07_013510 [Ceratobasidium sp. 392]|nr:hypothetical protein FRC07_013510 [Ceratobasidium sp. 392]
MANQPRLQSTVKDESELKPSESSNSVYAALARTAARGAGLYFASTAASAIAGATAGAVQSIAGAPAENVRLLLEGGTAGAQSSIKGWRQAWKDVFIDSSQPNTQQNKITSRREAREVREWMKEVGEMAGRGWEGWGWSCAKDVCGFALFFSVFDLSRRVATRAARALAPPDAEEHPRTWRPLSGRDRIVQSLILVSGGVIGGVGHEIVGRPFDISRRVLHINETHVRTERMASARTTPLPRDSLLNRTISAFNVLRETVREEGYLYFFRSPTPTAFESDSSPYRRLHTALRTLGRVGPWGVAFVVWEATGGITV